MVVKESHVLSAVEQVWGTQKDSGQSEEKELCWKSGLWFSKALRAEETLLHHLHRNLH
jgi:hypothetical protein